MSLPGQGRLAHLSLVALARRLYPRLRQFQHPEEFRLGGPAGQRAVVGKREDRMTSVIGLLVPARFDARLPRLSCLSSGFNSPKPANQRSQTGESQQQQPDSFKNRVMDLQC